MPAKYRPHHLALEQTFALIKPDGVMRGLIGEIIQRFEQRGLKIVGLKMIQATRQQVDDFYPKDPVWIERLGKKALSTFAEYELNPIEHLGTDEALKIGEQVRTALIDFITVAPVVAMVIEGLHAVSVVRKLVGATLPVFADPGTIRGDFAHDAPTSANVEQRSIFNLIHASELKEEAVTEIAHWFTKEEIHDYDRADHVIMFGDRRNL